MTLPYDISRCENDDCDLSCRRKEPGHPTYQVFSLFPGGEDCSARIAPDDPPCTCCDGTGITKQTERFCSCEVGRAALASAQGGANG